MISKNNKVNGTGNNINLKEKLLRKPVKVKRSNDVWKKIESSNIHKVRYRRLEKVMDIVFIYDKFKVYTYEDVPYGVFIKMCKAESIGTYFKTFVKDRFKYSSSKSKDVL